MDQPRRPPAVEACGRRTGRVGFAIADAHARIVVGATTHKDASADRPLHEGMLSRPGTATNDDLGIYQCVRPQGGAGCNAGQEQTVVEGSFRDPRHDMPHTVGGPLVDQALGATSDGRRICVDLAPAGIIRKLLLPVATHKTHIAEGL